MTTVFAFDVDETLEVAGGPVKIADIAALKAEGHIVGLCGNWALATSRIVGWQTLFAFVGQGAVAKDAFLGELKKGMTYADGPEAFVFVGNDHEKPKEGSWQSPNDAAFAAAAGWEFVDETAFANGARRAAPAAAIVVPAQAFVSLCIIVKDGEKTIGALLDSVRKIDGVDEIVVVDTGSTDKTRRIIAEKLHDDLGMDWEPIGDDYASSHLQEAWLLEGRAFAAVVHGVQWDSRPARAVRSDQKRRWILATFEWVDDFAAARNYAFSLATGMWRMYLDADDEIECRAAAVLRGELRDDGTPKRFDLGLMLRQIAMRKPEVNTVSFPYEYVAGEAQQDVYRLWRWADGWEWRDAVHESLVAAPPGSHQRIVTQIADTVVVHRRGLRDEPRTDAFARNKRILDRELAREDLPQETRDRLNYGRVSELRRIGDLDGVARVLEEITETCRGSTFDVFAHRELAQVWALDLHERPHSFDKAVDVAGRLIARFPDLYLGYGVLGWVYVMAGQFERAARVFDSGSNTGRLPWSTNEAPWFNDGALPAARALAYAKVRRLGDAEAALADVKASAVPHHAVLPLFAEARRTITRVRGGVTALAYADFLLETQCPMDAVRFLEDAAAGALEHEERVLQTKAREIRRRLEHLEDFPSYQAAYASLPDDLIHAKDVTPLSVLSSARARAFVDWAAEHAAGDEPLEVLVVGVQDGYLEAKALAVCPRMHMTIAEAVPNARGVWRLVDAFPGRIDVHTMRELYDWRDGEGTYYDAVVLFEVLEHIDDSRDALTEVRCALKRDGELFLSTPAADRWADRKLATDMPAFFAHVKGWGPGALSELLHERGFVGDMTESFDGTLLFHGRKSLPRKTGGDSVAIFVPEGVTPFDPYAIYSGHLGGSEEAVIHLSAALARHYRVVVYAPRNARFDTGHVVDKEGVQWRETEEFDFGGEQHAAVLFWRCPVAMEQKGLGPYKKLLWLHDSYYASPAKNYARADKVLVLSQFHADVLHAKDKASRKNFALVANGVDAASFPPPDESKRDPLRVVYTSSPDRGLSTLLDLWPRIQAAVPGASLRIYYDWKNAAWLKPELVDGLHAHLKFLETYEVPRADGEGVVKMDVKYEGGVSHQALHDAMRAAGVWAYPHNGGAADSDGPSPETFCISAVKACATGCYPVTTNAGALPEVLCGGAQAFFDPANEATWKDVFVEYVVHALELGAHGLLLGERAAMREKALARFSWDMTAERFSRVIDGSEERSRENTGHG